MAAASRKSDDEESLPDLVYSSESDSDSIFPGSQTSSDQDPPPLLHHPIGLFAGQLSRLGETARGPAVTFGNRCTLGTRGLLPGVSMCPQAIHAEDFVLVVLLIHSVHATERLAVLLTLTAPVLQ